MIALELIGMSLSITRGGPMLYCRGYASVKCQKPGCSDERPVSP